MSFDHLVHCPHKASCEDGEDKTGDELEDDAVQPEGEGEVQPALQTPVVDLKVVQRVAAQSVVRDLHARRHLDEQRVRDGQDERNPCESISMLKEQPARRKLLFTNKTLSAKCDHTWLSLSQTDIPEIDFMWNSSFCRMTHIVINLLFPKYHLSYPKIHLPHPKFIYHIYRLIYFIQRFIYRIQRLIYIYHIQRLIYLI